eukprot:38945_1
MAVATQQSDFNYQLKQHIGYANSLDDLLSFLAFIPLSDIQNLLITKIDQFNEHQTRTMYFNSLPLDIVLPESIIQSITSYNECRDINSVFQPICKQWVKYFNMNQKLLGISNIELQHNLNTSDIHQLLQTTNMSGLSINKFENELKNTSVQIHKIRLQRSKQRMKKQSKLSALKWNDKANNTNTTWIIDENKTDLNLTEQYLGYKGPYDDIKVVIDQCKNGDTILIKNGTYIYRITGEEDYETYDINIHNKDI